MIGREGSRALMYVDPYVDGLSVGLAQACISMMVRRNGRV